MGTSTDAIVGFGVALEDVDDYDQSVDFYELDNEEKYPLIKIGYHCSDEHSIPYVSLKECHQWAWRGNPIELKVRDYLPSMEEMKQFRAACIELGIGHEEFEGDEVQFVTPEPKWFLCSYWG